MNRPRVLLADDHRGVAQALTNLLSPEFELVGVVEDGVALIDAATKLEPDVIVADISMPLLDGMDALGRLKKKNQHVKFVFITMYEEAALAQIALDAGAFGFVLKHSAPAELVPAVRAALDGKTYISPALARQARKR